MFGVDGRYRRLGVTSRQQSQVSDYEHSDYALVSPLKLNSRTPWGRPSTRRSRSVTRHRICFVSLVLFSLKLVSLMRSRVILTPPSPLFSARETEVRFRELWASTPLAGPQSHLLHPRPSSYFLLSCSLFHLIPASPPIHQDLLLSARHNGGICKSRELWNGDALRLRDLFTSLSQGFIYGLETCVKVNFCNSVYAMDD